MKAIDLIRALEATGLTQYRIAKEAGIPQPTISRISSGQPNCLSSTLDKLRALARSKGLDPDKLAA